MHMPTLKYLKGSYSLDDLVYADKEKLEEFISNEKTLLFIDEYWNQPVYLESFHAVKQHFKPVSDNQFTVVEVAREELYDADDPFGILYLDEE